MHKLKSIYINNYKCLQNFELNLDGTSDMLLLAKNGMGKSTVLSALRILRRIALGETDASRLFTLSDFAFGNQEMPIRFKVVLASPEGDYEYELAIGGASALRPVVEGEALSFAGNVIFSKGGMDILAEDRLMLPLVKGAKEFCAVLAKWILIMPIPSLMTAGRTVARKLDFDCGNFISWLKRLLGEYPTGYDDLQQELSVALPDFRSFEWNDMTIEPTDNLYLTFGSTPDSAHRVALGALSDGEKIAVLGATLVALSRITPGFLCFWDEPDNYLAVSEVQDFITRLRKYLRIGGCQLILSSHNVETIRTVGIDATKILFRASHHEPTRLMSCADKFKTDEEREKYIHNVLSGEIYVD